MNADDLIKLQKDFNSFYGNGMISVANNYIQLSLEGFKEIRVQEEVTLNNRADKMIELQSIIERDGYKLKICCLL